MKRTNHIEDDWRYKKPMEDFLYAIHDNYKFTFMNQWLGNHNHIDLYMYANKNWKNNSCAGELPCNCCFESAAYKFMELYERLEIQSKPRLSSDHLSYPYRIESANTHSFTETYQDMVQTFHDADVEVKYAMFIPFSPNQCKNHKRISVNNFGFELIYKFNLEDPELFLELTFGIDDSLILNHETNDLEQLACIDKYWLN